MTTERIKLSFTEKELVDFCRLQIDRSANPGHALAALTSLQAFIALNTTPDVQASDAYKQLRETLAQFLTTARNDLLEENSRRLLNALQLRNIASITTLHGELSRSGFQQTAERALGKLEHVERMTLLNWSGGWCRDATERANAASPYPDAPDFKAAGIDYKEYVAMMDINNILATPVSTP